MHVRIANVKQRYFNAFLRITADTRDCIIKGHRTLFYRYTRNTIARG